MCSIRKILAVSSILYMAVMISSCTSVPAAPVPFADPDPTALTGTLENGIPYYIIENKEPVNTIRMQLVIQAGSLQDPEDKKGLAHVVEHMNFQGTENFKSQEIIQYLESIGMRFGPEINAYTNYGSTVYLLNVPADDIEAIQTGLQILQDWAKGPVVDEQLLENEKNIVLEEHRLYHLNADYRFNRFIDSKLYKGSAYEGHTPIGIKEHISSITKEDIAAFADANYTADNTHIVIVGTYDKSNMESLVKKHFTAALPNGKGQDGPSFPPVQPTKEFSVEYYSDSELQTPSLTWYTVTPPVAENNMEGQKWDFFAFAVTFSLTKRIEAMALHSNSGISGGSADYWWSYGHQRFLRYKVVPKTGNIEQAYRSFYTQLKNIYEYGLTKTEFQQARDTWRGTTFGMTENQEDITSFQRADAMTRVITMDMPYPHTFAYYMARNSMLGTVNNASVHSWIKEKLMPEEATLFVQTREETEVPQKSDFIKISKEIDNSDIPRTTQAQMKPLIASIPEPGSVIQMEEIPGTPFERWELSNGINIYLYRNHFTNNDLILKAYAPGGKSAFSDEEAPLVPFSLELLKYNGLGNLSAVQVNDLTAGKKASVTLGIEDTFAYISGTAAGNSSEDLELMFKLLYANLTGPRRNAAIEKSVIENYNTWIKDNKQNPDIMLANTITDTLYGSNPRSTLMTPELFKNLNADMAYTQHQELFGNPADFTFVISGEYGKDTLKEMVEQWLASIPSDEASDTVPVDRGVRPVEGPVTKRIQAGKEEQAVIVSFLVSEYPYSEEAVRSIFTLQEILKIRMYEVLRQEKGGTYGSYIHCSIQKEPYEHAVIQIRFSCDPEKQEEMQEALTGELGALSSGEISDAVFNKAVKIMERNIESQEQTNAYWADRMFYALKDLGTLEGLPYLKEYYSKVTKDEIISMAAEVLNPVQMVTVIRNAE